MISPDVPSNFNTYSKPYSEAEIEFTTEEAVWDSFNIPEPVKQSTSSQHSFKDIMEEEKKLPVDEIEEICSDFELCMNFLVENYDDEDPN